MQSLADGATTRGRRNTLWHGRILSIIGSTAKYFYLVLLSLLAVYPFLWVLMSSFKDNAGIFLHSFSLPRVWLIDNYVRAWTTSNLLSGFYNSVVYTIAAFVLIAVVSSMAAYVIARVAKSNLLLLFFTIGIMMPIHTVLIPLFIIQKNLGLLYTRAGLVSVYTATNISLSVFVLTGFLKSLPKEMEEAATIDGCPRWKMFFIIVFPLVTPAMAAVSIFNFLMVWNDFLLATVFSGSVRLANLTVALYHSFKTEFTTDFGMMCAGIVISIIPTLIAYSFFQEKIVKGVVAGAVKG